MKIAAVAERVREVVQTLGRIVVGKDDVLERILAGVLANGHVLVEDYPGLAKTLIARLLAQALDLGFRRIQFTPDLLPSDITGSFLYDQREGRFEFRQGRSSPTCCWPTRSTAPRRRPRPRCWRRCRNRRSRWRASRSRCPSRSWSSPRRTRSSSRARIRCPKRSSTASSCAWPSAIPMPRPSARS
jgi:hypothetical protein